ncbi:MAG: hypothetical protein ACP5E3_01340 [Bacteroidales bacterium]
MKSTISFINTLIVFLAILMASSNNTQAQYGNWHKDTIFHGIEFKKIRFRNDGKESLFAKGILKHNTIIQGYPCYREIILDKEGNPKQFILYRRATIAGNEFEKDTRVVIQRDGDYSIWCLYEAIVQGYQCKGTSHKRKLFLGLPGSNKLVLYPGGSLKTFMPVDNIQIQGVWCRSSAFGGPVRLYESGKLKQCTSAREQTIQGVNVEKDYTLKFNEEGKMVFAEKESFF